MHIISVVSDFLGLTWQALCGALIACAMLGSSIWKTTREGRDPKRAHEHKPSA
jgi:hypothetical protein